MPNQSQKNITSRHQPTHEMDEVPLRPILIFGLSLFLLAVLIHLLLWGLFSLFNGNLSKKDRPPSRFATERPKLPKPILSHDPSQELKILRANENAALNSYEWVNRDVGVIRIPIDRAMDIIVTRSRKPINNPKLMNNNGKGIHENN
jgi:hypothetical protein